MAAAIGNLAEICVNSKAVLGPYSGDWERYFRFTYLHGPYFRDFWQKYNSMWSAEVTAVFLTPIADLEPPAPTDRAFEKAPVVSSPTRSRNGHDRVH